MTMNCVVFYIPVDSWPNLNFSNYICLSIYLLQRGLFWQVMDTVHDMKYDFVVVGGGIAGVTAVETVSSIHL